MKRFTIPKYHLLLGIVLGIWTVAFLIIIAPFDVSTVRFQNRLTMMPGYGILFTLSYFSMFFVTALFPNFRLKGWKQEVFVGLYLFLVTLFPVYFYYRSSFVQGEHTFSLFIQNIYSPFFLIILPFLFFGRLFIHKVGSTNREMIVLGKGKYDRIVLPFASLVYIRAADNYLEINYLEKQQLKKRLVRYTLKGTKHEVPKLIQTHRSYLLNPDHFISWKNRNTVTVTFSEVPVSDGFRKSLPDRMKLTTNSQ